MKMPFKIAVIAVLITSFSFAFAGTKVDQGAAGASNPWLQTPPTCLSPTHTITSVGLTAAACPASQLAGRRFVILRSSPENTGTPLIKIRIDGTNPVMGNTNVGDVLRVTDAPIIYYIGSGVTPKCISDTSSTALIGLECK